MEYRKRLIGSGQLSIYTDRMRRFLWTPLLALTFLSVGCSFVFTEEAGGQDPVGGIDAGDQTRPDAGPAGDLTRTVSTVQSGTGDFLNFATWKSGRGGNLVNRQQLQVQGSTLDDFGEGEMISGSSGCEGSIVRQSETAIIGPLMTLDLEDGSAACEVGEVLTGSISRAEATVLEAGPKGIEEEVQLLDPVYFAPLRIDNLTTESGHRLIVRANPASPHDGIPMVATRIEARAGQKAIGITIESEHVTVSGFEITNWYQSDVVAASEDAVLVSATGAILDRLLIHDSRANTDNSDADGVSTKTNGIEFTVQNSFIYNIDRAGILVQAIGVRVLVRNNTFYQCLQADDLAPGKYACIAANTQVSNSIQAVNNILATEVDTAFAMEGNPSGPVFSSSHNNACNQDLPEAVPACVADVVPVDFVAPFDGDLHLSPLGLNFQTLVEGGVELEGLSVDIDGQARTALWSIGADEVDEE